MTQIFIPEKRIFICQGFVGSAGKPGGFTSAAQFHRFAIDECGFTGYSLPVADDPNFFSLTEARKDPESYVSRLNDRMRGYGYNHDCDRVEAHTTSQPVSLRDERAIKFGGMIDPGWENMSVEQIRSLAVKKMKSLIDVCSKTGIKHIIVFLGGRGFGIAQCKWPGWPRGKDHFKNWVLASLVADWNELFEYAADRGIVLYHELGHEESDLLTGKNFAEFYSMLTQKAQKGSGVNFDMSHFLRLGVNPIPHLLAVLKTGCPVQNHYKGGVIRDYGDGSCSSMGGWDNWMKASHTFVTVGTTGDEGIVREFHRLMAAAGAHMYYEAECIALSAKDSMSVGGQNLAALRDGTPLVRIVGLAQEIQPVITTALSMDEKPYLVYPDGQRKGFEPAKVAFDEVFTDHETPPHKWLGLSENEIKVVQGVLERAGLGESAAMV